MKQIDVWTPLSDILDAMRDYLGVTHKATEGEGHWVTIGGNPVFVNGPEKPGEGGGKHNGGGGETGSDRVVASGSGQAKPRQLGGRAPKGGAIGALNDEVYGGGQFMANTSLPKMTPAERWRRRASEQKQEIEPYKYEKPPTPISQSIYKGVAGTAASYNRDTKKLTKYEPYVKSVEQSSGKPFEMWGHGIDGLITKFNDGGRWVEPTKQWITDNPMSPIAKMATEK